MKYIYILLLSVIIPFASFSQLEVGAGWSSVAASDGVNAVSSGGIQMNLDYNVTSDSKLRVAPGLNTVMLFSTDDWGDPLLIFDVMPGVQVGLEYVNLKVNYSLFDNLLWYGLGSRIPIGDSHGISISLQASAVGGIGLGWGSVGYSYKFN